MLDKHYFYKAAWQVLDRLTEAA